MKTILKHVGYIGGLVWGVLAVFALLDGAFGPAIILFSCAVIHACIGVFMGGNLWTQDTP